MKFGKFHNAMQTMYPSVSRIADHTAMKREAINSVPGVEVPQGASVYGYVVKGGFKSQLGDIRQGTVFALNDDNQQADMEPGSIVWYATRYGFRVPNQAIIPEHKGRLSYIDGCSDSLLVYPPRKGDGSLSLLYFPQYIEQSFHTHPSIRLGYVASGHGVAHFYDVAGKLKTQKLKAGDSFLLEEHVKHRFCTLNSEMRILAYHPDGEWGPEDENHTMLNRTYLTKK